MEILNKPQLNIKSKEFEEFYDGLSVVLSKLKCCVCKENSDNSVRLKLCNHIFCHKCIRKGADNICMLCQKSYNGRDRQDNYFGEIKALVKDLDSILHSKAKIPYFDTIVYFEGSQYCVRYLTCAVKIKVNRNGEVPLHLACKTRSIQKVTELLKNNHNINQKDYAGWTPLHEAVIANSVECCRLLLENGALVDTPGPDYVMPLHKAVENGNLEIVKLLLNYGASVDAIDFNGYKPCDYTKDMGLVKFLLKDHEINDVTKVVAFPTKITLYAHSIDPSYVKQLKRNKSFNFVNKFALNKMDVSHIVVKKSHNLSSKILAAIVHGVHFLTETDVPNLNPETLSSKILNKEYFDNHPDLNRGIQKSIMNKMLNRPKLFDGCSFFLMHNKSTIVNSVEITEHFLKYIIELGGGKLLVRMPSIDNKGILNYPFHTNKTSNFASCSSFVVFNDDDPPLLQYKVSHVRHVSSKWLIKCVIQFSLTD
ncbi:unnamed protein product [Brassicogethes aeneus]|uniref:Uncharacterized protein n=1 Tax=Brassicogethes aeneus TaxID=1431903 RepID=A0A9P0FEI2_BRAAE|nr:unnamed protein product [Brassicogethes aeneus]